MTIAFLSTCVGLVGVVLVLVAYGLLQAHVLLQTSASFYGMNLAGSLMLLFSLIYHWNTPSVVIEIAWLLISVVGLWRCYFGTMSSGKAGKAKA